MNISNSAITYRRFYFCLPKSIPHPMNVWCSSVVFDFSNATSVSQWRGSRVLFQLSTPLEIEGTVDKVHSFVLVFIMSSKNQIFKPAKILLLAMSPKDLLWVGAGGGRDVVLRKVELSNNYVSCPCPTIWTLDYKSLLHFTSFHFSHSALCLLMKIYRVGGNRKYTSCLLNQILTFQQ